MEGFFDAGQAPLESVALRLDVAPSREPAPTRTRWNELIAELRSDPGGLPAGDELDSLVRRWRSRNVA